MKLINTHSKNPILAVLNKPCSVNVLLIYEPLSQSVKKQIEAAADIAAASNPDYFAGETTCMFYKLEYCLPCDNFSGLKYFELRMKESAGLRYEYRGFITIDITEWQGHLAEEYFSIFIKYIADHTYKRQYVFICGNINNIEKMKLLSLICTDMTFRKVTISEKAESNNVHALMRTAAQFGNILDENAATELLRLCQFRKLSGDKALFMKNILIELSEKAAQQNTRFIDMTVLNACLKDSDSMISMMKEQDFLNERINI